MPQTAEQTKSDTLLKTVNRPPAAGGYPAHAAGSLGGYLGGTLDSPFGNAAVYYLESNPLGPLDEIATPPVGEYEFASIPTGSTVIWQSEPVSNGRIADRCFALPTAHLSAEEIVNARAMPTPLENTISAVDWSETYTQLRKLLANRTKTPEAVNLPARPAVALVTDPQMIEDAMAVSAERERITQIAETFELRDQQIRVEHLRERSSQLARRDAKDLLDDLAVERGLSWSTIAAMLGLSPTAIRKWRRGGSVNPENREQLAALVAFFEMLGAIKEPIADVGSWVEMRVREDATITPAQLYAAGPLLRWQLLEWARGYIDAATMLDRFDEDWRTTYRRDADYIVGEGPDGERAIIPR